ncbi:Protein SAP1 [Penicillium cataractarum]|uniref:Protein SAP1 n=1 Tax=Penicillium cataractarum TaxID=2100454 RepID=A0A9W9VHU8_9EURO|nr:Protein SAP1 [Penicillium cataractarum]KAJ5379976.1 Protein SAP1 [Penicillium cataractarum]
MMRPRPASSLQKTYDECYLACSTAVYFEGQNNEEEALRSWRSALETIYHHNARRVPSNYTPKSETERALQDSIRALEVQCRERVDLLEALRESRKESAEANGSKDPATLVKGKFPAILRRSSSSSNNHPGWIGDGTIPAVGYTDLSKPAAIPGRHSAPSMAKHTPESQTLHDDAPVLDSPALRVNSNSSEKTKSRGSSPERRKTMLTTLRNTDGKKNGKKSKVSTKKKEKEMRPAASKAAGLAWGNIYRTPSSEKTVGDATLASSRQMAASDPSFRREMEPRTSSGDEPASSGRHLPRRDSAGDRIPAANWREPKLPASPSRLSPRPLAQMSPRKPQPSSESRKPVPPHSGPVSMPDPRDFTPKPTSSPAPKPSIKPKPVGLRTSLPPPPRITNITKSEGNSQPTTPRQDRDGNVSSSKPRTTKSTPRGAPASHSASQSAYMSPSSGSDDIQRGVDRMSISAANGNNALRRKPPPVKRRETPPSSDQESWEQRSSEGEAEDEDEGGDNQDIAKILSKLPKGVDLQSARQILNDIVVRGDEVHWDDIAGLDGAKKALKEAVVYPFLRPDLFSGLREPARGMLLFGPPGTGKTMLARAVATESKSTFFSVSSSSLTSKWHGESEKLVRALFGLAKVLAPSIIFVDEIDSLLSARSSGSEHEASRRSKTEFLIQWSDLQRAAAGREQSARDKKEGDASRVLVLAATNMPWDIDEAARRRFVRRQYIPLPEHHVREQQLRKLLSHQHHELSDEDIEVLVHVTEGFSGSDITALAKDAAMGPLRNLGEALLHTPMDQIRPIKFQDFEASLYSIRPSVSPDGLRKYEDWARDFGERGG